MNKILICAVTLCAAALMSNTSSNDVKIKWLTWEEAVKLNEESPRKIFVDVFTDWCGWCKRMDATTFQDPEVVRYMNDHFYAVKLDAETRDEIKFRNQEFKYVEAGKGGVHTLAYSLLEGKMSYPSFVTLSESYDRIAVSPGFKQKEQMLKELKFAAEEQYKEVSWKEFSGED